MAETEAKIDDAAAADEWAASLEKVFHFVGHLSGAVPLAPLPQQRPAGRVTSGGV